MKNIQGGCFCLNYFLPFDLRFYLFLMQNFKLVGERREHFALPSARLTLGTAERSVWFHKATEDQYGRDWKDIEYILWMYSISLSTFEPYKVQISLNLALKKVQKQFLDSLRQAIGLSNPREASATGEASSNTLHSSWEYGLMLPRFRFQGMTIETDLFLSLRDPYA